MNLALDRAVTSSIEVARGRERRGFGWSEGLVIERIAVRADTPHLLHVSKINLR
jgi:hypothetical protein